MSFASTAPTAGGFKLVYKVPGLLEMETFTLYIELYKLKGTYAHRSSPPDMPTGTHRNSLARSQSGQLATSHLQRTLHVVI